MSYLEKAIALAVVLCFSINLNAQNYIGPERDIEKILQNSRGFSTYYVNGEAAKLANCYTTEGKIIPDRNEIVESVAAIQKRWTLPIGIKALAHKITPAEIRIVEEYAYDYGYYEVKNQASDGTVSAWKGKYVIVWRKVGEDWKICSDTWNKIEKPSEQK
ncbi:MAG: DUF4440 domain-containing protein [Saprospiraceae bacterium]